MNSEAHLGVIGQLTNAAKKVNALRVELELLKEKPASVFNFLARTPEQLEEETLAQVKVMYTQIQALDIDTEEGKDWKLDVEADEVAKEMAKLTKELGLINRLIDTNKMETESKRDVLQRISDARLNAMNEIKDQEKKISDGKITVKVMESTRSALREVMENL